jgi:ribosome-associated translation inhibitor RaiA
VDITVYTVRNGVVRVEDSEGSLYASIDLVADKLERKMVRVKERAIAKGKWHGRGGPKAAAEEEAEFKEYLQQVCVCYFGRGLCEYWGRQMG